MQMNWQDFDNDLKKRERHNQIVEEMAQSTILKEGDEEKSERRGSGKNFQPIKYKIPSLTDENLPSE